MLKQTQPCRHETTYTISGNTSSLSMGSILLCWLICRCPNNILTLLIFNAVHLVHCVYYLHDDGKLHDATDKGSQWPKLWVSWFFSKMAHVTSTHKCLCLSQCRVSWQMDWTCGTYHMPPPPPSSENLSPLDFSLWEFKKDVYHIWLMFYIHLWAAVAQHWGVTKVNYNMLQQKWEEGNSRAHTEQCG